LKDKIEHAYVNKEMLKIQVEEMEQALELLNDLHDQA
jgi:hypothetical protein